MVKRGVFWMAVLLVCLVLSGCYLRQNVPVAVQIAGGNQSWFDAPLNGMTIPLAPYEIVLHAYSDSGVTQMELNANGELLTNLPNTAVPGQLAIFKYQWTPQSPGNYTLSARAQSGGSSWGGFTSVTVTVGNATDTPTPTQVATITLTPTWTLTPSPSQPGEVTFNREVSTNQFFYNGCNPDRVFLQVQVSDAVNVNSVVLFQKLEGQGWDSGTAMGNKGNGLFSVTIAGDSVPGHADVQNAAWLHQFVATDRSGNVIGRSQTFNDVTLSRCGEIIRPEVATTVAPLVPVLPPIIRVITDTPSGPIIK